MFLSSLAKLIYFKLILDMVGILMCLSYRLRMLSWGGGAQVEKSLWVSTVLRYATAPVHKKNEKNLKWNYLPISLLPVFSNILEKLIYDSLFHFHFILNFFTQGTIQYIYCFTIGPAKKKTTYKINKSIKSLQ